MGGKSEQSRQKCRDRQLDLFLLDCHRSIGDRKLRMAKDGLIDQIFNGPLRGLNNPRLTECDFGHRR